MGRMGEGAWVHNVSERQLEWGWPFPGQIRLACQDRLEGQIEALGSHTFRANRPHTRRREHTAQLPGMRTRMSARDDDWYLITGVGVLLKSII